MDFFIGEFYRRVVEHVEVENVNVQYSTCERKELKIDMKNSARSRW